jgi:hypothetical protein
VQMVVCTVFSLVLQKIKLKLISGEKKFRKCLVIVLDSAKYCRNPAKTLLDSAKLPTDSAIICRNLANWKSTMIFSSF